MKKIIHLMLIILLSQTLMAETKTTTEEIDPELKKMKVELDKITTKNKLQDEILKEKLYSLDNELQKLTIQNKVSTEKNKREISELNSKLEKIKIDNNLNTEELVKLNFSNLKEKNNIDIELKRMEFLEKKVKFENEMLKAKLEKIKIDLDIRDKNEVWKTQSNKEPIYTMNPYNEKNKELIISDRRIPLNGPIIRDSADFVTERIHYFNNISTQPIFIVIDNSPGGSVMAGYKILKAMETSKAPVYVVLKSFAASMAAVITTMAQKSFVYPNAIILHHQMSTLNWGNMTQLKEQLDLAKEWEKRLHIPVAKKMGISMEEFRKKMYEKNSDGDWQEFGDKAVSYKWADYIVERIDETGIIKNPDYQTNIPATKKSFDFTEKLDEKGFRYTLLPRLEPFDFYFIYNPDRYYR